MSRPHTDQPADQVAALRVLRKAIDVRRLTQAELSRQARIAPSTVSRLLSGELPLTEKHRALLERALSLPTGTLSQPTHPESPPSQRSPNAADARITIVVAYSEGLSSTERFAAHTVFEHVIKPAIETVPRAQARFVTIESLQRGSDVAAHVLADAHAIVLDITDESPIAMLEVGRRAALGAPLILITRTERIPRFPWTQTVIDITTPTGRTQLTTEVNHAIVSRGVHHHQALWGLVTRSRHGEFLNPFQSRLSAWLLGELEREVERILSRAWFIESEDGQRMLADRFSGVVGLLGFPSLDEYWTVTNMTWWSNPAIANSKFLATNVKAAISGVVVKRVFLIQQDSLGGTSPARDAVDRVVNEHLQAVKAIEANSSAKGRMLTKFLVCPSEQQAMLEFGHFGIARDASADIYHDQGCVVITPDHQHGQLRGLRFDFSEGPSGLGTHTGDSVQRFLRAFEQGESIQYTSDLERLS